MPGGRAQVLLTQQLAEPAQTTTIMDAKWRLLEPWCRKLAGMIEAVPLQEDSSWRQRVTNERLEDLWELRVLMPRPTNFTLHHSSRQDGTTSSEIMRKLQAIREALDLLWLVHSFDESLWTWVLVHRCGVGGFEAPTWTDNARILPVLRLQPYLADGVSDMLLALDQCAHLVVTLQDESLLSDDFRAAKQALTTMLQVKTPLAESSYSVGICNWMCPRARLTALESTSLWIKLGSIARVSSVCKGSSQDGTPRWALQSLDLHLLRMVVTLDASLEFLELIKCEIAIDELWIDLIDRPEDHLTSSGTCALLVKLLTGGSRPWRLRVDCGNATLGRLDGLVHVLRTVESPAHVSFERFALSSSLTPVERAAQFSLLGTCLANPSIKTLRLDIPELTLNDVAVIAQEIRRDDGQLSTTHFSSLLLSVDCHHENCVSIIKLLTLVGGNLQSLELQINGGFLPESAPRSIFEACPNLQHLKLHRLQLTTGNPFVDHLELGCTPFRSLSLPSLQAPLWTIGDFTRALANPRRSSQLISLHLDLSGLTDISGEIVDGFTSAMNLNPYVNSLTLTLDSDAAAALSDSVHDNFYQLHNERVLQPLQLRTKLAFVSTLTSSTWQLSQYPLSLIFELAAAQTRRRVSIREPGVAWEN